ncbi:MAG TPA: hypothetical protein VL500_06035 [Candidatus Eisenbacteria bacterium]|jgi:hypothetical protein|nr:hypothetical protein [Candidatus Eisenbacteria bacterium]
MEMTSPTAKPASAEPAPAQGAPASGGKAPEKKKKKGSCLRGCFLFFVVLLLLAGAVAAIVFRLPEKLHLVKSPAERLYAGTPYRAEAQTMKEELKTAGVNTTGMDVTVFPVAGTEDTVAVATLDASEGFHFSDTGEGRDAITDTFIRLAGGDAAKDLGLDRVAIAYKDAKGRPLVAITAPTDAIRDFADGKLTKEQFYQRMDDRLDLPNLQAAIQEEIDAYNAKQ